MLCCYNAATMFLNILNPTHGKKHEHAYRAKVLSNERRSFNPRSLQRWIIQIMCGSVKSNVFFKGNFHIYIYIYIDINLYAILCDQAPNFHWKSSNLNIYPAMDSLERSLYFIKNVCGQKNVGCWSLSFAERFRMQTQ